VAALVLAYCVLLRSVLRIHPRLRRCLTRCRHCRIFFLTDPRNAGRGDLGCPFGCREAHRRRESHQRSGAYYRDEPGKLKKTLLNARRRKPPTSATEAAAPPPVEPLRWPHPILSYVRLLVRLIEARPVSVDEVLEMLTRAVRQHTMVRTPWIDQVVTWLHEGAP
jgi:hypothetical protein